MAVAHEAYARSHAGTGSSSSESSFAFDLAATDAAGVLVFVLSFGNTSNLVSAVDVEGVAASLVSGGRAVDTAGETGDCQAWFVGSGLPAGTLTITVERTNNSVTMMAYAVSFTASADTEAYASGLVLDQEDGTLAERSVDDGSPGTDSLRYGALNTGLGAPPSVGSNTTSLAADDYGARCSAMARETTAGQGSRSIGWSSASSDDRAGVYAIYETASPGGTTLSPSTGNLRLTGQTPDVDQPKTLAPTTGNLRLTGQTPTLTHPVTVSPTTGHAVFTGYAPTIDQPVDGSLTPTTGHLALTGYAPTIDQPIEIDPTTGHAVFTGYTPTVSQATGVSARAKYWDGSTWQPITFI